jgi:hypothetical protein
MKVYMVWVYDWPNEMVLVNDRSPIEGAHSRERLMYKYQNIADTKTAYFRKEDEYRKMINYFDLEPDSVKEIEL